MGKESVVMIRNVKKNHKFTKNTQHKKTFSKKKPVPANKFYDILGKKAKKDLEKMK